MIHDMRAVIEVQPDGVLRARGRAAPAALARLIDDSPTLFQVDGVHVTEVETGAAAVALRPTSTRRPGRRNTESLNSWGPPRRFWRTVQQQSQQKQTASIRS